MAVGDFNGDADPDLAVANAGSDNVSVLLGGAGGSFGTATNFAAGDGALLGGGGRLQRRRPTPTWPSPTVGSDNVSVLLGGAGGSFGAATDFAAGD